MSAFSPSEEIFISQARPGAYFSAVKKIVLPLDPFQVYQACRDPKIPSVFLESARVSSKAGRFSFAGIRPDSVLSASGKEAKNPFSLLKKQLEIRKCSPVFGAPPFLGGAVGFAGYEARRWADPGKNASVIRQNPLAPDLYFLFFSEGIVWDHQTGEVFLFSHQKTSKDLKKSYRGALGRLDRFHHKISRARSRPNKEKKERDRDLADILSSSADRDAFCRMVETAKGHIRRGDIFQANLSQQLIFSSPLNAWEAYRKLRKVNPSSFFGFLDGVDFQLVSGSPERLLKYENGVLETRPIAGTRARGKTASEDRRKKLELLLSEKERAEHIMLVDLERNDLGRVCEYGSVSVDELMTIEDYSHVQHIVSNVRGVLKKGLHPLDAFLSFFPGGTITGTPKIRSMEIIDSLETAARGAYTGSLGYFSWTGSMDFNIIIRSLFFRGKKASLSVGAGIVADSEPHKEYDETLYKAEAVLTALFGKKSVRRYFQKLGVGARAS